MDYCYNVQQKHIFESENNHGFVCVNQIFHYFFLIEASSVKIAIKMKQVTHADIKCFAGTKPTIEIVTCNYEKCQLLKKHIHDLNIT